MSAKERRAEFPQFDRKLRKAASEDMAAYVREDMPGVTFWGGQCRAHWRHHNAACVCALITKIRLAA